MDTDRIDNAILALLFLGRYDHSRISNEVRAWKTFDWDAMSRLHEKGMISDPVNKNKSETQALTSDNTAHGSH